MPKHALKRSCGCAGNVLHMASGSMGDSIMARLRPSQGTRNAVQVEREELVEVQPILTGGRLKSSRLRPHGLQCSSFAACNAGAVSSTKGCTPGGTGSLVAQRGGDSRLRARRGLNNITHQPRKLLSDPSSLTVLGNS